MNMRYHPWKLACLALLAAPCLAQTSLSLEVEHAPKSAWVQEGEGETDEPAPLPDKRDEVKKLLEELKANSSARGTKDTEAVANMESLMGEFPKSGPKDRQAIVKGLSDVFNQPRKQAEDGTYNNQLFIACSVALSKMGPESAVELVKWIDNKKHNANLALRAQLIRSLGQTKAEVGIKPIQKLLGHKDIEVEAAAAEALGQFNELELKQRKAIFEEVLKALMSAKNDKDADINNQDPSKSKRYNSVSAAMLTTLKVLSNHEESTPEEWQTWWNKNKKANWDETKES